MVLITAYASYEGSEKLVHTHSLSRALPHEFTNDRYRERLRLTIKALVLLDSCAGMFKIILRTYDKSSDRDHRECPN